MCVETTKHCCTVVNILLYCYQCIFDGHFKEMAASPFAPILILQQILPMHFFFTDSFVRFQFYRSNAKWYYVSIKLTENNASQSHFSLISPIFLKLFSLSAFRCVAQTYINFNVLINLISSRSLIADFGE